MRDGDISNQSTEVSIALDGKGLLYTELPVHRWLIRPVRVLKFIARKLRSTWLMWHLVHIEPAGLRALISLQRNSNLQVWVMTFSDEEEFILDNCMLKRLRLEHLIDHVYDEEAFRCRMMQSKLFISNHFDAVVTGTQRLRFNSADDLMALLGEHVKWGK